MLVPAAEGDAGVVAAEAEGVGDGDLDYTPNVAVESPVNLAISDSLGFGGHNACVAFRRWDEQ